MTSLPLFVLAFSCKVVIITGYDQVLDETATKLKHDYNVFFSKLSRNISDTDPKDQDYQNFTDYYDNMHADLKTLEDRSVSMAKKASIVKSEVQNIKKLMIDFEASHKKGFKDFDPNESVKDDHHDQSDDINLAIDALLKTEEVIKTTGN